MTSTEAIETHTRILICDPDTSAARHLADYMQQQGYRVSCVVESGEAINAILTLMPDVVLLDTQLPVGGGFEVCRRVRSGYNGLVLFQSRNGEEEPQLLAFELDADDYIIKPISPVLMAAKLSAHLRRNNGWRSGPPKHLVRLGDLVVDAARREVHVANRPIDLTTAQFNLLWYLANRPGRVVSRKEIYEVLYQSEYNGFDRSVDVYVSRIRQQLGDHAENPRFLKTVRGAGYLFVSPDKTDP